MTSVAAQSRLAVRVRCRTADAVTAGASPAADVSVVVAPGDGPAAVVAAAVRVAGGAGGGARQPRDGVPPAGAAFPWLPAASGTTCVVEASAASPALIVCVMSADVVSEYGGCGGLGSFRRELR